MNWFKLSQQTPFNSQDEDSNEKLYKSFHELDQQKAYDVFRESYEKSTGKSWDQNKFHQRAYGWRFYGDENGYITVREQNSGMLKLTGVAGDKRSILKGFQDLMQESGPIWGMVDQNIKNIASRLGFKSPPGLLVKLMIGQIPPKVFGYAAIKNVGFDGGVTFEYSDIGEATKYLIGNSAYFSYMLQQQSIPDWAKAMLQKLI